MVLIHLLRWFELLHHLLLLRRRHIESLLSMLLLLRLLIALILRLVLLVPVLQRLECLVHFIEELSISLYELNHDWVNVLKFGLDDFLHLIVALIVDHLKGLECLIILPLVLHAVR